MSVQFGANNYHQCGNSVPVMSYNLAIKHTTDNEKCHNHSLDIPCMEKFFEISDTSKDNVNRYKNIADFCGKLYFNAKDSAGNSIYKEWSTGSFDDYYLSSTCGTDGKFLVMISNKNDYEKWQEQKPPHIKVVQHNWKIESIDFNKKLDVVL